MTARTFLLTVACCLACALPACCGPATITVDCTAPGPRVNPHMYGIFFEELNHSGDGGLYAELLRNRSFEDGNIPEGMHIEDGFAMTSPNRKKIAWHAEKDPIPGWQLIKSSGFDIAAELDTAQPLNPSQIHSLRLNVLQAGKSSPAGIANTGYWGVPVKSGDSYQLSLYARCDTSFRGTITARLEDASGKPLSALTPITGAGAQWKKLACSLKATATDYQGRLAVYFDAPGTIWLDVASLFPTHTYKDRANGLRPDIVQMLIDLHPGFMRFPGGCITEGLTLEQGYNWKKTIGDIAERPGVWNAMWGYRRTDGLGFHELLQLCEDTGAAPMFCLNVGVACTIHSPGIACPMSEMQKYVDDAVDAVAYANDPPTTKWGALRAKNGHPQPFDMKYVNIGNELKGAQYAERYPMFYKAIKDKYPDITTIAYCGLDRGVKTPVEITDIHDYRDDAWFIAQMNRFDNIRGEARKPTSCTELAARNQTNHTLHNALLEAAYMTGMERNADMVRAVSYAPLLWNVNLTGAWQPDLIHFNNHQVYGTPSYYVQRMFMTNRPDVVYTTRVSADRPRLISPGRLGLGALDTQVEYSDIRINRDGKTIFDGSSTQPADWKISGGKWEVNAGKLTQSNAKDNATLWLDGKRFSDCTLTFTARKISGTNGFKISLGSFYGCDSVSILLGDSGNRKHRITWLSGNQPDFPAVEADGAIETGRDYQVKVEIKGTDISCWLDGKLAVSGTIPPLPAVYAVAGRDEKTNEIIIKAVNLTAEKLPIEIALKGLITISPKASQTVLTSTNEMDQNSFENPTKVSPKTTTIPLTGPKLSCELPANSFSVFRVGEK